MSPKINRTNFDAFWIEYDSYIDNSEFIECILIEKPGSRELIKEALNQTILEHHFPLKTIQRHLKKLEFDNLARELPIGNTRKGNFGEIVASEHLCQRYNYEMPVYKLRYRDSPMPMRGEDVVAFKIENGIIKAISIGEAKFMAEFDSTEVKNAHIKLEKTYSVKPYTLSQIRNILDDKDDELALQVDNIIGKLGSGEFPRENWIFIVSGTKSNNPFGILKNMSTIENLHVFNLYLENLIEFTEEVYKVNRTV